MIYYVAKNSNKKIPFSQDYKAAHGAIKQLILFQESWEKKKSVTTRLRQCQLFWDHWLNEKKKNKHNYVW